jgi:hypothetical protein
MVLTKKRDFDTQKRTRRALRDRSVRLMATASVKPTWLCIQASFSPRLLPTFLALLLLLLAGCGPRSNRLAVSGAVTLDGAPLDAGSIRLTSTGNGKLFASGAMIQNGKFHVPQEKGVPPGTYRVEISSPDTAAPPVVYKGVPGEPALPPTAPERIPPEYNSNSKQTIEVSTGGDNVFNFDIVRRRAR